MKSLGNCLRHSEEVLQYSDEYLKQLANHPKQSDDRLKSLDDHLKPLDERLKSLDDLLWPKESLNKVKSRPYDLKCKLCKALLLLELSAFNLF